MQLTYFKPGKDFKYGTCIICEDDGFEGYGNLGGWTPRLDICSDKNKDILGLIKLNLT